MGCFLTLVSKLTNPNVPTCKPSLQPVCVNVFQFSKRKSSLYEKNDDHDRSSSSEGSMQSNDTIIVMHDLPIEKAIDEHHIIERFHYKLRDSNSSTNVEQMSDDIKKELQLCEVKIQSMQYKNDIIKSGSKKSFQIELSDNRREIINPGYWPKNIRIGNYWLERLATV